MGRLEGIHYVNPTAETLAKYGLTWDSASRITAMNLDGEPAKYGYDATSQLTSATYENLPAEAYQYDANGNRKNFETGKNNQLTFDGEFRYTYDDEGNRITKGKTRYLWDHRNRLVRVVTPKKTVEYQYDYRNRLTRRNDEFFVHDGWQIVCSLKNGKVVDRYLWGARQDELLCENDGVVLADHLGTIRKIVGKGGKVVSELKYDAFGRLLDCSGVKPRFRYTGKLFDDETGLQWNVNRWYDANVEMWTSEDPIRFQSGSANLYEYVNNTPLHYFDFWGFAGCPVINFTHTQNLSLPTFSGTYRYVNIIGTQYSVDYSEAWSAGFTIKGKCKGGKIYTLPAVFPDGPKLNGIEKFFYRGNLSYTEQYDATDLSWSRAKIHYNGAIAPGTNGSCYQIRLEIWGVAIKPLPYSYWSLSKISVGTEIPIGPISIPIGIEPGTDPRIPAGYDKIAYNIEDMLICCWCDGKCKQSATRQLLYTYNKGWDDAEPTLKEF